MSKTRKSSTRLLIPEALEPKYTTMLPNAPVVLFEGELRLSFGGGQIVFGPGMIELRWLPFPSIRFKLLGAEYLSEVMRSPDVKLNVPDLDTSCDVVVTRIRSSDECIYEGFLDKPVIIGGRVSCRQIWFHLPNFFSVMGESIRNDGLLRAGRLNLKSNDLNLVLDEIKTARDLIKGLKARSGFALTSVGVIERIDGDLFNPDQVEDTLSALHYFFSFVRGFWCGPTLEFGMVDGDVTWRRWQHPKATPWKYVEGWFPYFHYRNNILEINEAFHGFMARWNDDFWKTSIKHSIHWYVESNTGAGGIEGSIILAQTALELLGWVYFVEDSETEKMSSRQFNKKSADEKIRSLLNELNIPTDIPETLRNLRTAVFSLDASDGPTAITKLRNAFVHPKKSHRDTVSQVSVSARMEAHALGLWYIEMALLHLFGYKGEYYQRFLTDTLNTAKIKVPWCHIQ